VTLLEAGRVGGESSWAGAGVLAPGSWNRHDSMAQLVRDGIAGYGDFVPRLEEASGIDVEYVRCGKLELLYTDQHVRMARSEIPATERYESKYGPSLFGVLTSSEAQVIEPNIAGDAMAVAHCQFTSQIRNPRLLVALRSACERAGVRIVEGCPARGFLREKGRVVGVQCSDEPYRAEHTVLCAGAWSGSLDPAVRTLAPVYPVRGQVVLLRQHPVPFRHVVERGKCYLVPRRDGRILIGATEEHEAGFDKSNTAGGVEWLLSEATKLVPKLAEAQVERTWAGLRPGTPDRRPVIGTHEFNPGLIFATGHFRTGIVLALVTAEAVCDLVTTGRTEIKLDRCEPGREMKVKGREPG
jgi:glycine oxidase